MGSSVKERTIKFIKHKGIKMKTFEERCGLSTGYVTSMRSDWLLYGEGEMLNEVSQEAGSAAIVNNQVGNGNQFTGTATVDRFLDELAAQRELTKEAQQQLTKSQEQMDRLITIIEKLKD